MWSGSEKASGIYFDAYLGAGGFSVLEYNPAFAFSVRLLLCSAGGAFAQAITAGLEAAVYFGGFATFMYFVL